MFSESFELALRVARLLGIGEDNDVGCSPYDTEIRRRCWWALCKLCYHRVHKPRSVIEEIALLPDVPLPLNINDVDLTSVTEMPKARQGATEMSFFLINLEVVRLTANLELLSQTSNPSEADVAILVRRRNLVEEAVRKIENDFLWHCDTSRPLDWFLMLTTKSMLVGHASPTSWSATCNSC